MNRFAAKELKNKNQFDTFIFSFAEAYRFLANFHPKMLAERETSKTNIKEAIKIDVKIKATPGSPTPFGSLESLRR
jgi:hypothetical protein